MGQQSSSPGESSSPADLQAAQVIANLQSLTCYKGTQDAIETGHDWYPLSKERPS